MSRLQDRLTLTEVPAPTRLFGLNLVNAERGAIADRIVARAAAGVRTIVAFANAHCINVARAAPEYRTALETADLLLPDGAGMRIAAGLAGEPIGENLNGTDLFPELCARAAAAGTPIFLFGGQRGVAMAAAAAMKARFPGLKVAGTADGYFASSDEAGLIARINASGAKLLFVGLGVPRQDELIARLRPSIEVPVVLGVGGLFDYFSGRIPRAPRVLRAVGLEWAWRLAMEPQRLAARYLIGNFVFVALALAYAFRVRRIAHRADLALKRAGDLAMCIAFAPLLALIFAGVALAIKLDDGGPVFFRQTRIGAAGKPFRIFKFRSMVVDAEARRAALLARSERDAVCFKMKRDPRITRVGAVLRRLSLDELPQLLNVVAGEMTLVGPRPALPGEVIGYRGGTWARLGGKPGITCVWQVSGRALIAFEQQVEMDIAYLARRGAWTDLVLLLRTVPAVVTGRGAY